MQQTIPNTIMLITYADCMGKNLKDLSSVLDKHLQGAIGGLHILPFFPSTADRGFAPTTYKEVDPAFGTWDDIKDLGSRYYLMYDYMINHLSSGSAIYQDFLEEKDHSKYKDFFIRYKNFWSKGEPSAHDLEIMYRRKEQPWIEATFADGTKEKLWTTFSDHQIDINQKSQAAWNFHTDNLRFLAAHGASIIRLDAVAYAAKREGTSCFFAEPEIWELLRRCRSILDQEGTLLLSEIHEQYFLEKRLEEHGYWTYDFQLPMLLLNAIYKGRTAYLKDWLRICPRTQFTTLDTHDGIGVVDARYLMPDEELLDTRRECLKRNPGVYEMYARAGMHMDLDKFDTYQINCTYYSACDADDDKYFLARAVQFFTPGIPQVYYVGMLAGRNDWNLYNKTKANRDINRHYYSTQEVAQEVERPIVRKLLALMRLRNTHPAFDGTFHLLPSDSHTLAITWTKGVEYVSLHADFSTFQAGIVYSEAGTEKRFEG